MRGSSGQRRWTGWSRRAAALVGTAALLAGFGLFAGAAAEAAGVRAQATGGVTAFGNAISYGAPTASQLHGPIVGMATTHDGGGYWLAASDGGVYSYGDADFFGSAAGLQLDEPIVGITPTPDGEGYWLVASDGGIFAFGDAHFYGSTGALALNKPVVGMASTADGGGYWLVASDGGIFAFGDAHFYGSTGSLHLVEPVVGMASTSDSRGYWMVAADGGIFAYGDARFLGSTGGSTRSEPVVGMAAEPGGRGYWIVSSIIAPTGTCQPNQLALAYDPADSPGAAAGSVGRTYRLTNTSTRTCSLIGYPGLQLRDGSGHPMTTTVTRSPVGAPPSPVGLAPGASAYFTIIYATQTGFDDLVCPTSASLAVIPPNDLTALVVTGAGGELQVYGGSIPHLQCGDITVTRVFSQPPFR